jgi:type IV pilus assembly protein PilY1
MKTSVHQSKLFVIIIVSSLFFNNSAADDIDIYTEVVSKSALRADSAGHNILFVMDTSGSMGDKLAAKSPKGTFDNGNTYGNPVSAEKIYVYDENMSFTGDIIELDQNKCAGLATTLVSDNPVYYDKGVQWQQTENTIPGETTCEDVPGSATSLNFNQSMVNAKRSWDDIKTHRNVGRNLPYSIEFKNHSSFGIDLSIGNDYYEGGYREYCDEYLAPGETYVCAGTTRDSNNDDLQIWVWGYSSGTKPTVSYTGSVGTLDQDCTTTGSTELTVTNWDDNFLTPNQSYNFFECKKDRSYHGVSDISNITYVASCDPIEPETACSEPTYAADSVDEISWSDVPYKNYVSANYHDYRQSNSYSPPEDNLPLENPATYCDDNDDNREGDVGDRFKNSTDEDDRDTWQCYTRLGLMQESVTNLVDTLTGLPINIGLMRFNRISGDDEGGTIIDAVSNIDTNTDFTTKLNALTASGATPLSEVLYEAYLYYKGGAIDNGLSGSEASSTDSSAKNSSNYDSPIESSCQTNNIVFLSDGAPSNDGDRDTQILDLSTATDCGAVGGEGKCLDEIAGVMATTDMSSSVNEINKVNTYTIGLDIDLPILGETAAAGNGQYYQANGTTGLEDVFRSIVVSILNDAASFAAPAVSVNAFNELQHRNEVYYAVFQPSETPRWNGNIKKYKFDDDGNLVGQAADQDIDGDGNLVGEAADPGIIGDDGYFKDSSHSFWSAAVDGRDVIVGGAKEKLTNSRNVYTAFDSTNIDIPVKLTTDNFSTISLTSLQAANNTERSNNLKWLLGLDVFNDNKENENTSLTDANRFMADPIHTKPTVITYGGTVDSPKDVLFFTTNLGTLHAVDPLDANGTELWAHLPQAHRRNLEAYLYPPNSTQHIYGLDGEMTIVTQPYTGEEEDIFLDGAQLYIGERRGGSRYYAFDISNALYNGSDGTGLKLDSTYSTPFKQLFPPIKGAIADGKPATTFNPATASTGFEDLAQTWSEMVHTTLKYDNGAGTEVSKDVLIFSGGYDPRHDTATYKSSGTVSDYGNAIYIVDAKTGTLLHSIGNNDDDNDIDTANDNPRAARPHNLNLAMMDSIPATPSVIDVDGDGAVDIIFAVDIRGHIWRIDVDKAQPISTITDGGMIADLSSATENRRFYNKLDISRSNFSLTNSDHLNIAVGSGYRAAPSKTETFRNNMYVIFDDYPTGNTPGADRYNYVATTASDTTSYSLMTTADLPLTSNANRQTKQTAPNGYYRQLDSGEKSLQKSLTFNNTIVFTTFVPNGGSASACGGTLGGNRVYAIDAGTGVSVLTERDPLTNEPLLHDGATDADGNTVDAFGNIVDVNPNGFIIKEFIELAGQGIAAETTLLKLKDLVVCIGTECNLDEIEDAMLRNLDFNRAYRSFWREK